MLLQLTHETNLSYSDLISESVMELRVAPRQERDQHRLSFVLSIGPAAPVHSYFDWLGNTVHAFNINAFHRQIRIVATSVVETDRQEIDPLSLPDTWPVKDSLDYQLFDYLAFSGPILQCQALRSFVQEVGPRPGEPLGELAIRLMEIIRKHIEYEKGVTSTASSTSEILQHRKGVCQDFTHLMIAAARAMGIPARYVSGLLHPRGSNLRGYTQTHAWCELKFPRSGWIGFDPANDCLIGPNFVKVAVGRHYHDVPPNRGVYRGHATESMEVQVHTEELPSIPGELAAERIQSLPIAAYPASYVAEMARHAADQAQQQQQQQ